MTHDHHNEVVERFWRKAESFEPEGPVSLVPADGVGRRRFLQLLGTAVAIPSLSACTRQPKEEIVPYVRQPEQIVPGRPLFYATAVTLGGVARGVLVEQHMGRPTKVEGNPDHPASLGGTDVFAQAEILQLYDPERSQTVRKDGEISSWGDLAGVLQAAVAARRSQKGAGLAIVTGDTTSPTLMAQIDELFTQMPEARWYLHEPVGNEGERAGLVALFGEPLEARYRFDRADVVLSLDADFLGLEGNPRYIRDWAEKRTAGVRGGTMSRMYAVQSAPHLTSASADHRAIVRACDVEHVARMVVAKVVAKILANNPPAGLEPSVPKTIAAGAKLPAGVSEAWIDAVVDDLLDARGRNSALIVPGQFQPAIVHRLAHLANVALGSGDRTVWYGAPARASARPGARTDIAELTAAIEAGKVELLVISGCNPVYDDRRFVQAVAKAKLRVHHGLYFDETAARCHWHVPATHPFESWSDAYSYDTTPTIVQPLIEPLYAGKSEHEVIAALSEKPDRTAYQIVRERWQRLGKAPFDVFWRRLLHDGFWREGAAPPALVSVKESPWPAASAASDDLELVFRPDPGLFDGRYANNAWLQEMPKSITQLTWDNAVLVSKSTAKKHGLENGDVVRLERQDKKVEAAVLVVPGQPDGSITVTLGYGRERGGKVAKGSGFNAYKLRAATGEWHAIGVAVQRLDKKYELALAQTEPKMHGRNLARSSTLAAYREPDHGKDHGPHHEYMSLYPRKKYDGYAWGMTIDLASCIGCSACLVACQAENNVPVVGKQEVLMGREMHWIRIDRYFEDSEDNPDTRFQPVPCMHCENAPCEAVCPVQATVHHDEGLNDMVYNRCVGTKDCSANCAYKVRRFNFFGYGVEAIAPLDPAAASMRMLHNPDVTVRSYGVMEKCSYCVQRINYARVDAKIHQRKIRDGDVMTACQAACPARAITFGDINDSQSQVVRRKAEPRNYTLLADLNTLPRTSYLARITNPNERLGKPGSSDKKGHEG
jgi:molybdopterin-containing oxidoreductase family iron-sulfur binding subunit